MAYNPYEQYKTASINTMTPGEMLIALYDEIIKQLNKSIIFIQEKNIPEANKSLIKSQDIINYLIATLDDSYPISAQLTAMYEFFNQQIIQSNIKKETAYIDEILPMITDLKVTFAQADKLARK